MFLYARIIFFPLPQVNIRGGVRSNRLEKSMERFEELVKAVVVNMLEITPRQTVELGVIHGFCIDAAETEAPDLIAFLSSVAGLEAITAQLSRLPQYLTATAVDGATWQFVPMVKA